MVHPWRAPPDVHLFRRPLPEVNVRLPRWFIPLLAFFLLLAPGASPLLACQCMPSGPPCQSYFQSDVVFVGTVRSITLVPGTDFQARVRVEFEDAASSRGVEGTSITVFTSDNDASCGYAFRRGERYVVYADRTKDAAQIRVSRCSRTRPLAEGAEDVNFFATFSTPAFGAHVSGSISHWDRDSVTGDPRNAGPVPNVVLTLSGSDRSFQTRTGQDGRYEFTGVPPGQYLLNGIAPPLFSSAPLKLVFELRDARACHQADFTIRYDSRIGGSIVGNDGRPVVNAIVEITPAEKIGTADYVPSEIATSDQGGNFELTEVPPGRYILGVNLSRGPDDVVSPTRFHPDASAPTQATVFEVQAGERVRLDRMVIPPDPPAYRVSGRVTFPDGRPAAGVEVALEDGHQKWKRVAAEVRTGADGSFSFVVHEGLAYVANARYVAPLTPRRTQATASIPFVASEEKVKMLLMVLSPVRR